MFLEPFFLKVCAVCHQGSLGMFFFIVEMVMGQDTARKKDGSQHPSFYEEWLRALAQEAPMFLVSSFQLNTMLGFF